MHQWLPRLVLWLALHVVGGIPLNMREKTIDEACGPGTGAAAHLVHLPSDDTCTGELQKHWIFCPSRTRPNLCSYFCPASGLTIQWRPGHRDICEPWEHRKLEWSRAGRHPQEIGSPGWLPYLSIGRFTLEEAIASNSEFELYEKAQGKKVWDGSFGVEEKKAFANSALSAVDQAKDFFGSAFGVTDFSELRMVQANVRKDGATGAEKTPHVEVDYEGAFGMFDDEQSAKKENENIIEAPEVSQDFEDDRGPNRVELSSIHVDLDAGGGSELAIGKMFPGLRPAFLELNVWFAKNAKSTPFIIFDDVQMRKYVCQKDFDDGRQSRFWLSEEGKAKADEYPVHYASSWFADFTPVRFGATQLFHGRSSVAGPAPRYSLDFRFMIPYDTVLRAATLHGGNFLVRFREFSALPLFLPEAITRACV